MSLINYDNRVGIVNFEVLSNLFINQIVIGHEN